MNVASSSETHTHPTSCDVAVIGAGLGGIYAIYRLRQLGLTIVGLEAAGDLGGVWYHNRYPGARVDIRSIDYTYYFSPELFREWRWTERFAAQPELLSYLNFVADKFDIRKHFRFDSRMTKAQWHPHEGRWHLRTEQGHDIRCRFLIMTTGNLSEPRRPSFRGFDQYQGEWMQTARWPQREVPLEGRRIGIIGTGSSGVQAIPKLAEKASHLYVFQRTPNYAVPARNGPFDTTEYESICKTVPQTRQYLFSTPGGQHPTPIEQNKTASECTAEEQQAMLERQYAFGTQSIRRVFLDQNVDAESNRIVSDFVRNKIRERVKDPATAVALCPDHPIGARRIALETDYYETFNRDNVTLVNLKTEPIERFTESGIRTTARGYQLDLVVFALGFEAFTGAWERANIRNHLGHAPNDHWQRGPRTAYGLMTNGFPNLFLITGPGTPSVLGNLFIENEYQIDWVADLIACATASGYKSVEPTEDLVESWTQHAIRVQGSHIKVTSPNYQVFVCADGTRIMIPYLGGLGAHFDALKKEADGGYAGFRFVPNGSIEDRG